MTADYSGCPSFPCQSDADFQEHVQDGTDGALSPNNLTAMQLCGIETSRFTTATQCNVGYAFSPLQATHVFHVGAPSGVRACNSFAVSKNHPLLSCALDIVRGCMPPLSAVLMPRFMYKVSLVPTPSGIAWPFSKTPVSADDFWSISTRVKSYVPGLSLLSTFPTAGEMLGYP